MFIRLKPALFSLLTWYYFSLNQTPELKNVKFLSYEATLNGYDLFNPLVKLITF
jgi:hypothetical protein